MLKLLFRKTSRHAPVEFFSFLLNVFVDSVVSWLRSASRGKPRSQKLHLGKILLNKTWWFQKPFKLLFPFSLECYYVYRLVPFRIMDNRVIVINKQICHYAVTWINSVCQWSETVLNAFEINVISNGNTAEWSPIRSPIIQRTTAQQQADLFITSMITDQIGRHEVLLPINHKNYNFRDKKNRKKIPKNSPF